MLKQDTAAQTAPEAAAEVHSFGANTETAYTHLMDEYRLFCKQHQSEPQQVKEYVDIVTSQLQEDKLMPKLAIAWALSQDRQIPPDEKITPYVIDQFVGSDPLAKKLAAALKETVQPGQTFRDLDASLDSDRPGRIKAIADGLMYGWHNEKSYRPSLIDVVGLFNKKFTASNPDDNYTTEITLEDFQNVQRAIQNNRVTMEQLHLDQDQVDLLDRVVRLASSDPGDIYPLGSPFDGQFSLSKQTIETYRNGDRDPGSG